VKIFVHLVVYLLDENIIIMKKIGFLLLIVWLVNECVQAQGPPILTDKPIMMGAGRGMVMTSARYRENDLVKYTYIPIMFHYDMTENTEFSIMPSLVISDALRRDVEIGDLQAIFKYQFFRKDRIGKTVRFAAKIDQTFPTGPDTHTADLGLGTWRTYLGIVGGMESLKLGVQSELGYSFMAAGHMADMLEYKLGFGFPLLKPSYPVNQLNLYLETEGFTMMPVQHNEHTYRMQSALFYAPGIQYAINKWTFDLSVQLPLYQDLPDNPLWERDFSVIAGFRIIII